MKKIYTASVLFSLVFLIACSDSKKEEPAAGTAIETSLPAADNVIVDPAVAAPASSPAAMPDATPQQGTTVSATPTAEGMNPAHGQPNHRCDIPVGAPLNSPPGTNNAPGQTPPTAIQISAPPVSTPVQTSSAPVQTPSAPVQTSSAPTAPGMNPPHGQPGHDCAIPVGAPLKK